MRHLPSGTVTFLFTDIEGSTRLLHELGERYADVLAEHRRVVREAFSRHSGVEVDTQGDAFFFAFARADDAVAAAADAQGALAGGPVRVRIGVHTGEPIVTEEGYVGADVHRAARIMSAGHGGQVLLSDTTQRLLDSKAELRDLGEHRLKDLSQPQRLYQVLIKGLPSEFPALKTLENCPTNLPVQATALIGREHELNELDALLGRDNVRLVTLTGPGGTGKTRLALQLAAELIEYFPNGVFFVALAPISDPDLLVATIAQTLGVREQGGAPLLQTLSAYLREKRMLLLLDNFEQIGEAAPAVASLLASARGLKVVATSRAALHLSGEQIYDVPPLDLPDLSRLPKLEVLRQFEAVALFIERAQAAKLGFTVTNENAASVAEICVRLDGLPLALELAAARVRSLPPQTLLSRLDHRLKLLTGGAQDLDARQRTLRATIEWSYDLLPDREEELFAGLGVFVGGCRLEAAEAVCALENELDLDVLDGLTSLVEKSLVRQREEPDGEARFWMLETIREYALERLAALSTADAVRRKHAEHFLRFAVDADAELRGERSAEWLDRFEKDSPNFHAALTWSGRHDRTLQAHLANALAGFWGFRGHLRTGLGWLEQVLDEGDRTPSELRTATLRSASYFTAVLGDWERMRVLGQEWLTASQQLGDRTGAARALIRIGVAHASEGDIRRARGPLEQSLTIGRELQDADLIARALGALGYATHEEGDFAAAAAFFDEALSLERQLGHRFNLAIALKDLGFARLDNGQKTEAAEPLRESLQILHQLKAGFEISFVLEALAALLKAENPQGAVQLLGKADELREQTNAQLPPTDLARLTTVTASTKSRLDVTQWERAWSEGRQLSLDEAVTYALEHAPAQTRSS